MLKTITLNPDIPILQEKDEHTINNQVSFPSICSLKNQNSMIPKTEHKGANYIGSFLHYKRNVLTNSVKRIKPLHKEQSLKLDTLHNLTRLEEGFISSPSSNLAKKLTSKDSNMSLSKIEQFSALVSSRTQNQETDKKIKTRFPFEFNIKILVAKMNAYNFEFKMPIAQEISVEDMQIYNEIRYIMWMRPELSTNSFNIENLVLSVTSKLLKEQCNTRILLIEWLRIYSLLYKNYKMLKNIFLSYNIDKKQIFEDGFLMKFESFHNFCNDINLNTNKIYEAFYLSSRYDKNLDELKQTVATKLVSEMTFDEYLKDVVLSPSEDNYINLSGFLEGVVRIASLCSENELVSESIDRVINCNIKIFAKSTLSLLYDEIYKKNEIAEVVAHYEDGFKKAFYKFRMKSIYNIENQLYNSLGSMRIKEFEYLLRQLKMLKSPIESRITEKKINITQSNILVNGFTSKLKYDNMFKVDDLARTDDERISQNQMFELFTYVINDTKAYVKCKEKPIESELRMTYSEFVKVYSLIAIRFWCTLYKFVDNPIKDSISEIFYKSLEKLGIDSKQMKFNSS